MAFFRQGGPMPSAGPSQCLRAAAHTLLLPGCTEYNGPPFAEFYHYLMSAASPCLFTRNPFCIHGREDCFARTGKHYAAHSHRPISSVLIPSSSVAKTYGIIVYVRSQLAAFPTTYWPPTKFNTWMQGGGGGRAFGWRKRSG